MIEYTRATTPADLEGILALQQQNLSTNLPEEEKKEQGFLTVVHRYKDLERLNNFETHIIAKEGNKVTAYLLCMTQASRNDIPVLQPMFDVFDQLNFAGKNLTNYKYIVVGQVCVAKDYRGKGMLDHCYAFYKEVLRKDYAFAITEIAASNSRSLQAHKRIGFQELHRYNAPDGKDWVIVVWDWNQLGSQS